MSEEPIEGELEEAPLPHEYRIEVHVKKDGELISRVGDKVYSHESFAEVFEPLSDKLSGLWMQVGGLAPVVDEAVTTPVPPTPPEEVGQHGHRSEEGIVVGNEVEQRSTRKDSRWKRWFGR